MAHLYIHFTPGRNDSPLLDMKGSLAHFKAYGSVDIAY